MTDNCPECLFGPVTASGAIRFGGTVLALHTCPACGHQWTCSWDAASLDPDLRNAIYANDPGRAPRTTRTPTT